MFCTYSLVLVLPFPGLTIVAFYVMVLFSNIFQSDATVPLKYNCTIIHILILATTITNLATPICTLVSPTPFFPQPFHLRKAVPILAIPFPYWPHYLFNSPPVSPLKQPMPPTITISTQNVGGMRGEFQRKHGPKFGILRRLAKPNIGHTTVQ
jgi:hypothetical protein